MSPAAERGLEVGDKVRLLSDQQSEHWQKGEIVTFINDDYSRIPEFEDSRGETIYIHIDHVEKTGERAMTVQVSMQQLAIDTFSKIVERAIAYRENPEANDRELFNPRYGICDNVSLCMPKEHRRRYSSQMLYVKDNLIRQVPSFSGAYHYPVPAPGVDRENQQAMEREAENAYDNNSDKWAGDYGAERLIQAKELVDYVTNKWQDCFATEMTPCQRNGIVVMETVVVEKETGEFYLLQRDDESNDPYFIPFGDTNNDRRKCIRLQDIRVLREEDTVKRSAASLINELNRRREKRLKLEEKVKALQAEVNEMIKGSIPLEMALLSQHNVKLCKR
jgi:hypothetical protein